MKRTATFMGSYLDPSAPEIIEMKSRIKETNNKLRKSKHKTRLRLKLRGRGEAITKPNLKYYQENFYERNGVPCGIKYATMRLREDLPVCLADSVDAYIFTELKGVRKTRRKTIHKRSFSD